MLCPQTTAAVKVVRASWESFAKRERRERCFATQLAMATDKLVGGLKQHKQPPSSQIILQSTEWWVDGSWWPKELRRQVSIAGHGTLILLCKYWNIKQYRLWQCTTWPLQCQWQPGKSNDGGCWHTAHLFWLEATAAQRWVARVTVAGLDFGIFGTFWRVCGGWRVFFWYIMVEYMIWILLWDFHD